MSPYHPTSMNPQPKMLFIILLSLYISQVSALDGKVLTSNAYYHGEEAKYMDERAQNIKSSLQNSPLHHGRELPKSHTDGSSESISPVGPPYPITASWFTDRFQIERWNQTMESFKAQGGDTIILRAPSVVQRTREELARDANFRWCGSYKSSSGEDVPMCYDEAVEEMSTMGHNVTAFLTYQYEEGFTDDIMLCPKYDRKINSGRTYYRIVLPAKAVPGSTEDPCEFPKGSDVVVLFTSFAGTDPHQLLLESAQRFNMSVFFGLPATPHNFQANLMPAYYAWVERVLHEHKVRFSKMQVPQSKKQIKTVQKTWVSQRKTHGQKMGYRFGEFIFPATRLNIIRKSDQDDGNAAYQKLNIQKKSLYQTLVGYYSRDECNLVDPQSVSTTTALYKELGTLVKSYGKRFAISPSINLNRSQQNSSVATHVEGFRRLAQTGVVDIIAVHEGRGAGKGCYYWPHQRNKTVAEVDPGLDRIIHYLNPKLRDNITFTEAFSASNQELFAAFERARNKLLAGTSLKFDFWLNVEAVEHLRDDPCLPVDRMASGVGELLNRASKKRIDRALSVAGAKVQKVISLAWDSDYTCTTKNFNTSLHTEIMADLRRPIIANCSFHSPHNLSVVILGFNLEGETQAFNVDWTDTRGRQRASQIHGYYFELDYGIAHNLVDSLQYVMLWDIPDMVMALAPTGTVNVSAPNAYEPCSFQYDLPYSQRNL